MSAQNQNASEKHDPIIEAFRGLAILFVLIFHGIAHNIDLAVAEHSSLIKGVISIPDFGTLGVDLFFILSGFLITRVLIRTRSADNYYSSFFGRRALRILPLYYSALVFLFFVSPRLIELEWFKTHQLYFWFYLQNWILPYNPTGAGHLTHFWSLSIEEQFYLFWPLLVRRSSNKNLIALGLLSIPLVACLRWHYYTSGDFSPTEISMNTFVRLDRFLLGAALAALFEIKTSMKVLRAWVRWIFPLCIAGMLVAKYAEIDYVVRCLVGLGCVGLAGTCLLFLALDPASRVLRSPYLLGSKVLQDVGHYSYGIYVVHLPLMYVLYPKVSGTFSAESPALFRLLFVLLSGLVSYGVARVCWIVIEAPCLKLKKRFQARFKN